MGKIRKPGRALFHTYCHPRDTAQGRTFQARVVDVRTGSDLKCTGNTFNSAVSCAKRRVLAEAIAQVPKTRRTGRTRSR